MLDKVMEILLENMIDEFNKSVTGKKTVKEEMKDGFKPHIEHKGTFLGYIGDKADIKDVNGIELCVGDIVAIFGDNAKHLGNSFVVKENGKFEIMGCFRAEFVNGVSKRFGDMSIYKFKSYKDLKHNDYPDKELKEVRAKLVEE